MSGSIDASMRESLTLMTSTVRGSLGRFAASEAQVDAIVFDRHPPAVAEPMLAVADADDGDLPAHLARYVARYAVAPRGVLEDARLAVAGQHLPIVADDGGTVGGHDEPGC